MEEIGASSHSPMEKLYVKLYDKYSKLKKEKESEMDDINRDQEKKFLDALAVADQFIASLESENDILKNELASIREQHIQFQNLMEEENQKRKPYSSFAVSKTPRKKFWGVEVKNGEQLKVTLGVRMVLHVTWASLSKQRKKANDSACVFLHIDGQKVILAKLSADKLPQHQLHLVFEKDFELSHNLKNGSIYMFGYKTENPYANDGKSNGGSEDSDSGEVYPVRKTRKPNASRKEFTPGKQKLKIVKLNKDAVPRHPLHCIAISSDEDMSKDKDKDNSDEEGDKDSSGDESEESDKETPRKVESTKKQAVEFAMKMPVQDEKAKITYKTDGKKGAVPEDDDSSDEDMSDDKDKDYSNEEGDKDSSGNESEESDKDMSRKVVSTKKQAVESAIKTPVQDKKAKITHKTDGKKVAPHLVKEAGKPLANKQSQKTPKSGGLIFCKNCNRSFVNEKALESHSKAKHLIMFAHT